MKQVEKQWPNDNENSKQTCPIRQAFNPDLYFFKIQPDLCIQT